MQRATAATHGHSIDVMLTPSDWRVLGGQIRAMARQLASLQAEMSAPPGCRMASECDVDVDHLCGGGKSE